MGWCGGGTEIFDNLVGYIIEFLDTSEYEKRSLIIHMIDALENQDWDCQENSYYYDVPLVRDAFEYVHPTWFKED